jgi:Holliday junction resolvase
MTNYSKGANFERQIKAELELKGYLVIRAAGSHGIVDLVAFRPPRKPYATGETWFVQCKIHGTMSPSERRELYETAARWGAWAVRASRPKRGEILYERLFTHGKEQWVEVFA